MCIWRREDITKTVFDYYQRLIIELKEIVEIQVFIVGSEGNKSKVLTKSFGFNYKEFPNSPLSSKQNQSVLFAKTWNPDGIVLFGSDDILDKKIFKFYVEYLDTEESKTHMLGFLDMYFYVQGNVKYLKGYGERHKDKVLGAGKFFSRELLDTLDWKLWDKLLNRGLDGAMDKRLANLNVPIKRIKLIDYGFYMLGLDCVQGLSCKTKKRERLPNTELKLKNMFTLKMQPHTNKGIVKISVRSMTNFKNKKYGK